MITEQELKDKCTPEIIKKMCELAEGFEFSDNMFFSFLQIKYNGINLQYQDVLMFPLLIHRAVEGWNKIQDKNCGNLFVNTNAVNIYTESGRDIISLSGVDETLYEAINIYDYTDYQPKTLTRAECAILDCLLEVLE